MTEQNTWDGYPPTPWVGVERTHYLREIETGDEILAVWEPQTDRTDYPLWWIDDRPIMIDEIAAAHTYICAVPTSAELAELRAREEYLRAALETEQITCEIPPLEVTDFSSACAAIRRVVGWHVSVALDPAVSEDACKLQNDAYNKALEEAAVAICPPVDPDGPFASRDLNAQIYAERIRAMKKE